MKRIFSIIIFALSGLMCSAQECNALFSWDGSSTTVSFTDLSTSPSNDPIVSWFWDFDDSDATSTLQNPTHTFSEPGTYNVELVITTASGCEEDVKFKVSICALSIATNLGTCDQNGNIPLTIIVSDVYGTAEEINILINGQTVEGSPFIIGEEMPITFNNSIAGSGLVYEIVAMSTESENCFITTELSVPDCNSNCFLSGLDFEYPTGSMHTVNIGDNFFNPQSVGIILGDLVRFNWVDGGHSTTSDATSGADSWNSGVINAGSTFDVQIKNPGVHPYYCIPHGGPGGTGMSGSILANCPEGDNMELVIKFNTTLSNSAGYNIRYDGNTLADGPFQYSGTGPQERFIIFAGDGNLHTIEIIDVSNPSCVISSDFQAPDCDQIGGEPICTMNLLIGTPGTCEVNGNIEVPITVNVQNGGSGFNLYINDIFQQFYPYTGPSNDILLDIPGDGSMLTIEVIDNSKLDCKASGTVTSPNCALPCAITDYSVEIFNSSSEGVEHIVNVEDFSFNPKNINISEGDWVKWVWVGDIPHSSTSDASTGVNSWDSGVVGKGATYLSPILIGGEHPYFCIPHGGPGGVGMSGKIIVLPICNEFNEVPVKVRFQTSANRGPSYKILIDNIEYSEVRYQAEPIQETIVYINGDGKNHEIQVVDSEDQNCTASAMVLTPECGIELECEVSATVDLSNTCDNNSNEVSINVSAINQSDSLLLYIDNELFNTFPYIGSLTTISINLPGDGNVHTLSVQDQVNFDCKIDLTITTADCSIPCSITNLSAKRFSDALGATTHTVQVEDFSFTPKDIEILEGDLVEWIWTGNIPHTTTSDATDGSESWDSGLLGNGASFVGPPLSLGEHPYYCIPHGGPGGVGMSGTISVLPECNENDEALYEIEFLVAGTASSHYLVIVDDQLYGTFPYAETPEQKVLVFLPGDGNLHTIVIKDENKSECTAITSIVTMNCNGVSCEDIHVDFEVTIDYATLNISLINLSSSNVQSFIWDFGDGETSTDIQPSHHYQDTGIYKICLSATDLNQCTEVKCEEVKIVNTICEPNFTYTNSGNVFTFINKTHISEPEYTLTWDFGDGIQIIDKDTVVLEFVNGIFTVCLQVSSSICETTYCEDLDLSDPCALFDGQFSFSQQDGDPLEVHFSVLNQHNIESWLWGFGDGTTSTDSTPIHNYNVSGIYDVCILIEGVDSQCLSSYCESIEIETTSVIENDVSQNLVIFPNPQKTGTSITLKGLKNTSDNSKIDIKIFSYDGRLQFEDTKISAMEITLDINLPQGFYYLFVAEAHKISKLNFVILSDF